MTSIRLIFELLSAVFVVTGLLVAIYSDSRLLRAAAGVAMIALVSVTSVSLMDHIRRR